MQKNPCTRYVGPPGRLCLAVTALLVLAGCGTEDATPAPNQVFATADGRVELEVPGRWFKNPDKHPYDLQCFSPLHQMTTGVFLFTEDDLEAGFDPDALLDFQVADMRSKREDFKLKQERRRTELPGIKLTTDVYTGARKRSKNVYRFTLVQFDGQPRLALIVLQTALPENWPRHEPVLDAITRSIRLASQD